MLVLLLIGRENDALYHRAQYQLEDISYEDFLFTSTIVLGVIDLYFVFIRAKSFSKSSPQSFFSFIDSLETKLERANLEAKHSPLTSTLSA